MLIAIVTVAVVGSASAARAAPTDEQKCLSKRQKVIAKHQQCQQRHLTKYYLMADFAKFDKTNRKCTVKFAKAWEGLQKIPVAPCNLARFVDNGDGTVTDNLSGLVWEKKDDLGGIQDKDNIYTWSTGSPYVEDGTAFTTFLAGLNAGGGFAGANGWRLPTWIELAGIRDLDSKALTCVGDPCIRVEFGPTAPFVHWSSTPLADPPFFAWLVGFIGGSVIEGSKGGAAYVRAVRGGL
jgi:hypothetical protein